MDAGRCRFARPSTVVRLWDGEGGPGYRVERAGVYDERIIRRMLSWTLLVVCSGNTCRSPMAEAIARRELARLRGLSESELATAGLHVVSAGLYADHGAPATPEAVQAMQGEGLDLAGHRSRPISEALIQQADAILTMTEAHRQGVVALAPWAESKTARLDPDADVADPIGGGSAVYRQTAEQIRAGLTQRMKELMP